MKVYSFFKLRQRGKTVMGKPGVELYLGGVFCDKESAELAFNQFPLAKGMLDPPDESTGEGLWYVFKQDDDPCNGICQYELIGLPESLLKFFEAGLEEAKRNA